MSSESLYIKSTKDFKKVFNEGRKFVSPHFVLYNTINNKPSSRLGIVVPNASIKLAVRRNRIKRILREAWRLKNTSESSRKDIVIIARKDIDQLKNEEIYKEATDIFNKILS